MLGAIPSAGCAAGRRCDIRDCRHEPAKSSHGFARLLVALRSTLALIRVLPQCGPRAADGDRLRLSGGLQLAAWSSCWHWVFLSVLPDSSEGAGAFALMSWHRGSTLAAWFSLLLSSPPKSQAGAPGKRRTGQRVGDGDGGCWFGWRSWFLKRSTSCGLSMVGAEDRHVSPDALVHWHLHRAPTREVSLLFVVNRGLAWTHISVSLWSLAVIAYRIRAFAAGSTFRRMVIVWCAVLIATVAILTVSVLPQLTALAGCRTRDCPVVGCWQSASFWGAALPHDEQPRGLKPSPST